jgi:hypothetical protein
MKVTQQSRQEQNEYACGDYGINVNICDCDEENIHVLGPEVWEGYYAVNNH